MIFSKIIGLIKTTSSLGFIFTIKLDLLIILEYFLINAPQFECRVSGL